jgi:hypothetical protein
VEGAQSVAPDWDRPGGLATATGDFPTGCWVLAQAKRGAQNMKKGFIDISHDKSVS